MQALDLKSIDNITEIKSFNENEYGLWEEYAKSVFAEFGNDKAKITDMVKDALSLLTVSERNFDDIKNQGFFKRFWKTLTGKNKALSQENQANLLRVQKIAIYMMNLSVARDMILAEAIRDIHNKLVKIRYDLARFQDAVITIFRKLIDKIYHIESSLDFTQIIQLIDKGYYDEYPPEYAVLHIVNDVIQTNTCIDDKRCYLLVESLKNKIMNNSPLTLKAFLYNISKQMSNSYAIELKERFGAVFYDPYNPILKGIGCLVDFIILPDYKKNLLDFDSFIKSELQDKGIKIDEELHMEDIVRSLIDVNNIKNPISNCTEEESTGFGLEECAESKEAISSLSENMITKKDLFYKLWSYTFQGEIHSNIEITEEYISFIIPKKIYRLHRNNGTEERFLPINYKGRKGEMYDIGMCQWNIMPSIIEYQGILNLLIYTSKQYLYSYCLVTNKHIWEDLFVSDNVFTEPYSHAGDLYIGCTSKTFYRYSIKNKGHFFGLENPCESMNTGASGTVRVLEINSKGIDIVSCGNKVLFSPHPFKKETKFELLTEGDVCYKPAKTDIFIESITPVNASVYYFTCSDGKLYAIACYSFLNVTADYIVPKFSIGKMNNSVYTIPLISNLDPFCIKKLWAFKTEGPHIGSPVIKTGNEGHTIYFGSNNSFFYAVDQNGNLKWKYQVDSAIRGQCLFYKENLFFASTKKIYCVEPDAGKCIGVYDVGKDILDMQSYNDEVYLSLPGELLALRMVEN